MPRIGPVQLASPFLQAGLAGYSDRAMRLVARRRGCPYAVTEALLDTILLQGGRGLSKSIDINDEDHPTAGQIIGSDPQPMAAAAKIMAEHDYDVVDLNFACPVKKIKNKARGGHMLRDVPRALSILQAVRDALPPHVPTTVSLRRGFDDSAESEDQFYQIVETIWSLGYSAIRVHARTVEQRYLGQSRWPFLKQLKQRYPHKTILGSGDVFTAQDAVRMLYETGVDLVWIARGAIGNPWIFQQSQVLLEGSGFRVQGSGTGSQCSEVSGQDEKEKRDGSDFSRSIENPLTPPTIHAQHTALHEHFAISMQIHGEQLAGRRMRKQGIKYSRFHPQAQEVKEAFIRITSLREWTEVLDRWYSMDAPGVWPSPAAVDEVNAADDLQSCEVIT